MVTFNPNVQNFIEKDSGYLLGVKKKENGDTEIYAAQKTWWRSLGIQICRFIGIKDNYSLAEIINMIRPDVSHQGLVQKLNGKIAKYNTNHTDSRIQQIALHSSIVTQKPTPSSSHVSSSSSSSHKTKAPLTARLRVNLLKNFHLSEKEKPAYFGQTFRKSDVPVTLVSLGWSEMYIKEPHHLQYSNQKIQADLDAREQPLGGDPKRYVLVNRTRLLIIDQKLHRGISKPLEEPQKVKFVASEGPKLSAPVEEGHLSIDTLYDIFNTAIAGFTLVMNKTSGNCIIDILREGSRANNDGTTAVYLLHCLASEALGIEIKTFGCEPEEAKRCQALWEKIQPSLEGKTFEKCIQTISETLSDLK